MKISSVSQMRKMDKQAIEQFGIIEEILMENAGQGACLVLSKHIGIKDKKFIIFCGVGNNGGDGLVIARKLHSLGGIVKIVILSDPEKYKGAAKINFNIVSKLPIDITILDSCKSIETDISHSNIVIDAIFGTGLSREVGGKYRQIIDLINQSKKQVLSLDIPSGVHGDTGKIMGAAVKADYTITFGLPKIGNMLFPGYDLCGKLYVTFISFPKSLYQSDSIQVSVNTSINIPCRNANGHKGSFGDVLFVAGAKNYFGAPYFAAYGFLKSGGGYSRLAAPKSASPFIAAKGSEIVFYPQSETSSGAIAFENKNAVLGICKKTDMMVIGPGLSLDQETHQLIQDLVQETSLPVIIDGDGITAISNNLEIIKKRKSVTILTPHPGEMAKITGLKIAEIEENRVKILQKTAKDLNAVIVLKGAHSLIGYPDKSVYINMTGNSGMATAGSGDVLTGAIAGMFGLGMNINDAVRMGVFIHGLAGDLAKNDMGEDGITAQNILDYLPYAVKLARQGFDANLSIIETDL